MGKRAPQGELAIRTLAMPANTNPIGDIFGGWVVSQMDLAGMSVVAQAIQKRVVTVAIDKMVFLTPVKVGDFVCCYADIIKRGNTSITVNVETWAVSPDQTDLRQVTEGVLTFVAIDESGRPVSIDR